MARREQAREADAGREPSSRSACPNVPRPASRAADSARAGRPRAAPWRRSVADELRGVVDGRSSAAARSWARRCRPQEARQSVVGALGLVHPSNEVSASRGVLLRGRVTFGSGPNTRPGANLLRIGPQRPPARETARTDPHLPGGRPRGGPGGTPTGRAPRACQQERHGHGAAQHGPHEQGHLDVAHAQSPSGKARAAAKRNPNAPARTASTRRSVRRTVCAASTITVAGRTIRLGMIRCSRSVADTATTRRRRRRRPRRPNVSPNFQTEPAMSSAVASSTAG